MLSLRSEQHHGRDVGWIEGTVEPGGSAGLLTGWVMAWSGVDRLIGLLH